MLINYIKYGREVTLPNSPTHLHINNPSLLGSFHLYNPSPPLSISTWVQRFTVHGFQLKLPNWLLKKGEHVDKYKSYVPPHPPAKVLYGGQVAETR